MASMSPTSPTPQLDDKVVLVTGAASGMGAACAELASERGATVVALDRDEAGLAELAARTELATEVCDLADIDSLAPLVDRCAQRHGHLDGLVNAAGIFQ